jgi:hypothetical protein
MDIALVEQHRSDCANWKNFVLGIERRLTLA